MDDQKKNRPHWLKWAVILACSTLFILVNTAFNYFAALYQIYPRPRPAQWWQMLREQMAIWYPMAMLAPLALRMGQRFRLERVSALFIHTLLGFAFNILYSTISAMLARWAASEEAFPENAWQMYATRIIGWLPISLIIYWSILGAGYAFEYSRRYREQQIAASRLETQLVQAQLQALRMQLQPHFLFNTLHAISALMDEDVKGARRMIARLSELLRVTLDHAGRQEVTLAEETEAIERYLEIEQVRFQDRLKVRIEIAPETVSAKVPNLILQPIVENAIRHAVARHSTAGLIEITSHRRDGQLELRVRDDGPGIAERENIKEGIGLQNTRARMRQLYGEAHSFEIANHAEGGLLVTLSLPFQIDGERIG